MGETTLFLKLIEGIGPTASVLLFVIIVLIRERRATKNGNGTDKTTLQNLASTQKLMAHTIDLIEENGSVPFQVYVARSEEKYKNLTGDVLIQGKRLDDQGGRLDVVDDGGKMTRQILRSVIAGHNRLHPEAPITGAD